MKIYNPITLRSSLGKGWLASLGAFLIIYGTYQTGALDRVEKGFQDWYRRQSATQFVSPIEIIYLDQVSLQEAERNEAIVYPWPREIYGATIDYLKSAKAKAVVFDFLFTSASSKGVEDDQAFADAARRHGMVIGGMQLSSADQPEARNAFKAQAPLHVLPLSLKDLQVAKSLGVDAPKPPLWGAFAGVGDTYFDQDSDGQGRRVRLFSSLDGKLYPTLALSAAWTILGKPALQVVDGKLFLGERGVPIDEQGRMSIAFSQVPPVAKSARLYDVAKSWFKLQEGEKPLVDPARFKDKIVLIGSSAPGLLDLRSTPMSKSMPGVQLQAMILENLLQGRAWREIGMTPWMWLLVLFLSGFAARGSFLLRGPAVLLPPVILAVGTVALTLWLAQSRDLLVPVAPFVLAIALGFGLSAAEHYAAENRQRRRTQEIFGQFLSPAVLLGLRMKGDELATGGETREVSVFFSDLQGFTSFSEKLGPQALVEILNLYLSEMADEVVGKYDGYVDKYIGDAIMAFWNAPVEQDDHALRACRSAWSCQRRLDKIQAQLTQMGLDAGDEGLVMRVGIHTGPAVVGLMGSPRKLNYTAMGDTVNTASRLEGANKPYGSRVMISETTRAAAGPSVICRRLDLLQVKGKAEPTAVHELVGIAGEGEPLYDAQYLDAWSLGFDLYLSKDFNGAKRVFVECLKKQPHDSVAKLYIKRCDDFIANPPADDWDGVYIMKTK